MTVGELIEALSRFSKNTPVICSADSEGNTYSPLSDVDECLYETTDNIVYIDQTYMTHAQLDIALEEGRKWYSEEDRAPEGAISAVCLWPAL